jgi:cell division protein ZapA
MPENLEIRRATTSITVDIYDQTYQLRAHDADYARKLASAVDAKMRAVSANGNTVDSLRVAILTALNIADDLARLQEHCRLLRGTMSEKQTVLRTRANSLSGLLDSVLDDENRLREDTLEKINTPSASLANRLH